MADVHVVTGAASGMGLACARRLVAGGGTVVTADLEPVPMDGVVAVTCDVSSADDVARLTAEAAGHGAIRSLVHAAGVSPTMADWRRIFEVDLMGTARILAAFEPVMAEGGAAVCVASMAAPLGAPRGSDANLETLLADPLTPDLLESLAALPALADPGAAYSWAKRGVIQLVALAAPAWGRRRARINSVSPGIIDTPMGRQELEQQASMEMLRDLTPLSRIGDAEDIAGVVMFLLSDEASFVTGIDVLVDGGVVAALSYAGGG
jgi:NAD(P)-dependent dehydrogenase (short-subunit alcohol dehydrogenase family)